MKRARAVVCLIGGTILAAAAVAISGVATEGAAHSPASMGLMAVLGAMSITLFAIGINLVLSLRSVAAGERPAAVDFRHTYPLFGLIIAGIAAALVARAALVPQGFGAYGYYRGDAPQDAREFPIRHAGESRCSECHEDEVELHDKDAHAKVPCETCHGPGAAHAEASGDAPIAVPKGKELCLTCHRLLDARPGSFPQVDWHEHYKFVGVKDEGVDCTRCHSPHEPLFMDRDLRAARLHPLIHRCRDCHIGRTDETVTRPANHPAVFECSYCHAGIVKDAATRKHKEVSCTTCHIFIKESEFAGRIIRDADPRFCLLCHRAGEFRTPGLRPTIDWPDHLQEVGAKVDEKRARCIDCHQDRIHATTSGAVHER